MVRIDVLSLSASFLIIAGRGGNSTRLLLENKNTDTCRVSFIAAETSAKNSKRTYRSDARKSLEAIVSPRFALRGNVLDLAIGIIIGTAFTAVVQSLVDDVLTPPLGLILGGVDFVNLTIKMKNFVDEDQPPVVIRYGKFFQTIISLFVVALALFFVVKGANKLNQLAKRAAKNDANEEGLALNESDEVKVLREIRDLLARQSGHVKSSLQ